MGILQVKVYQLPTWLLRRQFYNPIAYGRAMSRFCIAHSHLPKMAFWKLFGSILQSYSLIFVSRPRPTGDGYIRTNQGLLEVEPQVPAAQALRSHPHAAGGINFSLKYWECFLKKQKCWECLFKQQKVKYEYRVPLIPAYCHFHGWILPSQLQRSPAPQEREVCQQQFFTISYLSSKYEDKCHHQ